MTYAEAIEQATIGRDVMRPHWCWVKVKYDPKQMKSFLVDIDDNAEPGEKPKRFNPTGDDLRATDWITVDG